MLNRAENYERTYESFQWRIPDRYNIAVDICDKWADRPDRTALIYEDTAGSVRAFTFRELKGFSDKLANALKAKGISRGDRVGILLGQCPETAVSHLAVYKLGGIAIPLFTLFGTDALEYRLSNSAASALITDEVNLSKILDIRDKLPNLKLIVVTSGDTGGVAHDFWDLLEQGSDRFEAKPTGPNDPALIIYTSGTTGPPKGALHAHRVVLGHLPGVEFPHNFFPQERDLFWTPADWAWIGGLIDVLFPSWHHGIPVVAHRARKFDPEHAFHFIAKHGIRNAFMPPTALKLMRQVKDPWGGKQFRMRSIGSGGETLGAELLDWGKEVMGLTINEFYGQTEVNLTLGNCSEIMEIVPGSMGRPIPGHRVEVVDESGTPVPAGTSGEIAVQRPDPVMFLEYWNNPAATKDKYAGDWCLTGDLARKDERGYFWFVGRKDDIITSAGYRIGPAEIEDCLLKHPSVGMAAVVGSPDAVRTEIVKAFIVLKQGTSPDIALENDIKNFVKTRLAAHEFPREIEFVDELPMTATGKIIRKELKRREIERKSKQQ
ncbi:acyl-CoA synthetase [Desulfomonile tiedjei]|uniref:Acyl-CoA synthetase/AMP-acid ligase n=1 Tax=Desulfomonile tiedjei (strain ATCC 49306 / DSM 6799 / DCB-1) TaxID=706587 RepID=I4C074_DESTA|nr:acyl-CoA synthetase [Desulfomonile tiedjei]AFM22965.1 acyl-CoA synthetase/AMP-acid ligase [Desulfomonile tiedjei DSM 6799]